MPLNPFYTDKEIDNRAEALKQKLINTALARKIATSPNELAVRDILPVEDLGYSNEYWETAVLNPGWQTAVSKRLEDNKVIGFFGIAAVAPDATNATQIRFKVGPGGSRTINIYDFQVEFPQQNALAIFDEDIIYKNGEFMTIDLNLVSTGSVGIALLGYVVEPKGETVNQG